MRLFNSKKGVETKIIVGAIITVLLILMFISVIPIKAKESSQSIISSVFGLLNENIVKSRSADLYLGNPQIEESSTTSIPSVVTTTNNNVPASLSGDIAERVVKAAKEAGLSKQEAELILKLVRQESGFRHCCESPGTATGQKCSDTGESICPDTRILVSFDGTSLGAMQLNIKAHPVWFTTDESKLCQNADYKSDCRIKQLAGCYGKTAYDLDCNIRIGIRLLMANKNQVGSGKNFPEEFLNTRKKCGAGVEAKICSQPPKYYTGWDAALRAYVGWCCDQAHYSYVEGVNKQDVSQFSQLINQIYNQ